MKYGWSILLLALLATSVNASSLGDTILKGLSSSGPSGTLHQPLPHSGESYYGGKDLANIVVAWQQDMTLPS